jgi:monoamine oxidase
VAEDAARSRDDFRQYRTGDGYDDVLSMLEHDLTGQPVRIRLGTRVRRIEWAPGQVTVFAEQSAGALQVSARRCLVTVSIGVLQASAEDGGIELAPGPEGFRQACSGIGMGHVRRVVLRLARRMCRARRFRRCGAKRAAIRSRSSPGSGARER